MEQPNTSRSSAAGTSPAVVVDHGSSSANAQSHLSLTSFLTQPSPRSPAMGGGCLSGHGHATLLAGKQQPWQGLAPPPSWIASGIPLWSSGEGIFLGFTCLTALLEKIMAWVWRGEMSMSLATGLREPELIDEEDDDVINFSSRTRIAGSTQRMASCHEPSSSMAIESSSSMLTLSVGANNKSSTLSVKAGTGSSNVRGIIFTEAEKEIVMKDKNLQELMKTDPKKVKRTLSSRIYSAKRKAFNDMHIVELERQVATAQGNCKTLSSWLHLLKERCAELETENKEMSVMAQELEKKLMLEDAVSEALQTQLQTLKHIKLNAVQQTNHKLTIKGTSVWGAYGLHQRSGSDMNALHQQMNSHMAPLQSSRIQEQLSEHQQAQAQRQQHKNDQFMGKQQHPDI